MGRLLDAPVDPPDIPRLVRRRRITAIVGGGFLAAMILLLAVAPGDSHQATSTLGGLAVVCLAACVIVSVLYSIRIMVLRRRKDHHGPRDEFALPGAEVHPSSETYAPLQRLQAARQLLNESLPRIQGQELAIGVIARSSMTSLESAAHRIQLLERSLAEPVRSVVGEDHPDDEATAELRLMVQRFDQGVERYIDLTAQAASVADGLDAAGGTAAEAREATDRLAGLAAGLREVEQINHPR